MPKGLIDRGLPHHPSAGLRLNTASRRDGRTLTHSLPTCPFGRRARALTHCSGFSAATTLTFHWLGSQRSYGSRLLSGSACGPVVVLRAALNYPQPTVKVQATCLIAQPALCREAICHSRPSPGSLALKRGVRAALASAILSSLTLRAGRPVTPNPSLERTATGKPASASQLKR